MLRQWISPDAATQRYLATHNDFDLVQCLTSTGMRYLLKAQTGNFRRLHKKLYYDHTLVNVLLPTMLKHAGKSEPTFLELTRHFVLSGSPCALLGLRNRLTRRRLMEDLWTLEPITSLRRKCINKCTEQGEWTVLSHDATFKSLFSVLGQDKMAQKAGEIHAVHSILGKSGALPGLCAQHTEGKTCFRNASETLLPPDARQTTRWIFSDTPKTILAAAADLYPSLIGVAEDPIHLVFRVEACFGERRTPCSRLCLHIQKKFTIPAPGSIYDGESSHELSQGPCFVPTLPFLKGYSPSIHTSRQYIMSPFRPVICRTMESRTNTAASCRSRLGTIFPSSLSTSPGLHRRHPRSVSSVSQ